MKANKEQINGLLVELLKQPVSSGPELIAGDPPEVVVKVSDEGVLIAPYRAEWQGPHKLKVLLDADIASWSDLPGQADQLRDYLFQMIEVARNTRKDTFKICSTCHKSTPPEWMHNETTCQSCASRSMGIVY